MTAKSLSSFKSGIAGLARPNRFTVSFTVPSTLTTFSYGSGAGSTDEFMVRSAQLPGKEIGEISGLTYFGMTYKVAGDPTFADITLNFFNHKDFNLRSRFEAWMEAMSQTADNTRGEPGDYKAVMTLNQLDLNNNVTATYHCHGVWPKSVGAIDVSQDTQDEVEKFDVAFSVDYWSDSSTEGDAAATSVVSLP